MESILSGNVQLSPLDVSLQQKPVDAHRPRGHVIVHIVVPDVSHAGSRHAAFLQRLLKDRWVRLGCACLLGRYQKAKVREQAARAQNLPEAAVEVGHHAEFQSQSRAAFQSLL